MAISWDQLPLEMRQAVVSEMDVKSRVNLSMCSKSDNQLVRGTKYGKVKRFEILDPNTFEISFILDCKTNSERRVFVGARDHGGLIRYGNHKWSNITDWRRTIWNIMSLIGTRLEVESLKLQTYEGFQEFFNWFRSNFHIQPRIVEIHISKFIYCYDESIFDWPLNTKIELNVCWSRLPNLERFNTYDKIVTLYFRGIFGRLVTDEELKKMKNAKNVDLSRSAVTMNGFHWWLKNWLTRKDDNEHYRFYRRSFKRSGEFSFENVTNTLSDVIGKTETCFIFGIFYWKIEIKKNGKVGGIIRLFDNEFTFESVK